jgi:hypothetical protein
VSIIPSTTLSTALQCSSVLFTASLLCP